MRKGCFYKKNTLYLIDPKNIEEELPEIFRVDSMKEYRYPKYEYLSLLGIICCAGSCCIDRILLDTILHDNELYNDSVEFLCNRYTFYSD
tara:strand:+ start:22977 stop:23246 length:270 start_codon:yes stop_codon:yes gene_type:complete